MLRQNWRAPPPTTSSTPPRTSTLPASCAPYTLPTGIALSLASSTTVLDYPAVVTPECYTSNLPLPQTTASRGGSDTAEDGEYSPDDLRDPFYASTIPMAYSISATTTLAYVLLVLLFLPNPPNRRPWLQKIATLTVVICLTIAFAETTTVLQQEYALSGSSLYSTNNEARTVRERVVGGVAMRIGRIVSDIFLWLAQVQTLIRLFPREREKIIIKWAGFCLILLDAIFSILQAFVSPSDNDPDSFLDAIPALSYLFQIALSLLYAACVLYYSLAKRRYSYFYPHRPFSPPPPGSKQYGGRSIILVAILSISSVLTPLVFFVLDIAQKDLAGWGDYVRWVGAASASAVVWEWVDRIEGLEREETKGGVLGREVYEEEDEEDFEASRDMFEDERREYQRRRRADHGNEGRRDGRRGGGGGSGGSGGSGVGSAGGANAGFPLSRATTITSASTTYAVHMRQINTTDTPPPPIPTPSTVHRRMTPAGTIRTASTVSGRRATPAIEEEIRPDENMGITPTITNTSGEDLSEKYVPNAEGATPTAKESSADMGTGTSRGWNPFKRQKGPKPSTDDSRTDNQRDVSAPLGSPRPLLSRQNSQGSGTGEASSFASATQTQEESNSGGGVWPWKKSKKKPDPESAAVLQRTALPVTIIPAPPRGGRGTWGAVERARAEAVQRETDPIALQAEDNSHGHHYHFSNRGYDEYPTSSSNSFWENPQTLPPLPPSRSTASPGDIYQHQQHANHYDIQHYHHLQQSFAAAGYGSITQPPSALASRPSRASSSTGSPPPPNRAHRTSPSIAGSGSAYSMHTIHHPQQPASIHPSPSSSPTLFPTPPLPITAQYRPSAISSSPLPPAVIERALTREGAGSPRPPLGSVPEGARGGRNGYGADAQ